MVVGRVIHSRILFLKFLLEIRIMAWILMYPNTYNGCSELADAAKGSKTLACKPKPLLLPGADTLLHQEQFKRVKNMGCLRLNFVLPIVTDAAISTTTKGSALRRMGSVPEVQEALPSENVLSLLVL